MLFAGKEREARPSLPALLEAVRAMPDVQLVIKPHPAETPEVYRAVAAGARNVHVAAAGAALPPLLAAARAVVDGQLDRRDRCAGVRRALGRHRPAEQPDAVRRRGPHAGAGTADEIRAALAKVLYDQEFRSRIGVDGGAGRAPGDGQAAARSAEAILALARPKQS